MNVNEITEEKPKKPTYLELHEIVQTQQQEIESLKKENAALHTRIEEAMDKQMSQAQTIAEQKKQLEDLSKSTEEDKQEPDAEQEQPVQPQEALPKEDTEAPNSDEAEWKKWVKHPAAPFAAWGGFMLAALISQSVRADFVRLWQTGIEIMIMLNNVVADAVSSDSGSMLILSIMGTAALILSVFSIRWFIRAVKQNYSKQIKITIAAVPAVLFSSDLLHSAMPDINTVMVVLLAQIALILMQLPKKKKTKLKKPPKH